MSSAAIMLRSSRDDAAAIAALRRSQHSPPESILIYLAVPGSAVIPMRVLESDSIASVKLRIQSNSGFVVTKQRLVFAGRELARNECCVSDYSIVDGGVLHLVVRLSDLRLIIVETACGKKFKFRVERGRTVSFVKQRIAERGAGDFTGLSDQQLVYNGKELDDHRLISDICMYDDAVIHLLVRRSAKVRTKHVEKDLELLIVAPDIRSEPVLAPDDIQVLAWSLPYRTAWVEPVVVNPKVQFSPVIEDLIRDTFAGLEKGNPPVLSMEGSGGTYFMQDVSGNKYVAVFKPMDEEPMAMNNPHGLPPSANGEGLKKGTCVGEGALREVAAYILDHPLSGHRSFLCSEVGFSGVPPTAMVRCLHKGFNHPKGYKNSIKHFKIGSLQMYVKNYGSCEDMGARAFPVEEVHKICVLDIRLANADRHAGNILVCKEGEEGQIVLVPIDHGYCLPKNFEDCTFEWLYWPQACQPFNPNTVNYIKSLDAEQDIALLKFYGWELSTECAHTLRISTMLLKKGAERGLTPYDIGSILCRETLNRESKIEEIIREAKDAVLSGAREATFIETISEIMDRHLDGLVV